MDPHLYPSRLARLSDEALIRHVHLSFSGAKTEKAALLRRYEPLMKRIVSETGTPLGMYHDALQAARMKSFERGHTMTSREISDALAEWRASGTRPATARGGERSEDARD